VSRYFGRLTLEDEFVQGQVADFRCGIEGCRYGGEFTSPEWLEVRAAHRDEAHPDFREKRRRKITGFGRMEMVKA
jgi:hypothetical protein